RASHSASRGVSALESSYLDTFARVYFDELEVDRRDLVAMVIVLAAIPEYVEPAPAWIAIEHDPRRELAVLEDARPLHIPELCDQVPRRVRTVRIVERRPRSPQAVVIRRTAECDRLVDADRRLVFLVADPIDRTFLPTPQGNMEIVGVHACEHGTTQGYGCLRAHRFALDNVNPVAPREVTHVVPVGDARSRRPVDKDRIVASLEDRERELVARSEVDAPNNVPGEIIVRDDGLARRVERERDP